MRWLREKITNLQNRPYEERVRLWKRTIFITGLLMVLGLLVSLKFRSTDLSESPAMQDVWNIFKNVKEFKPSQ